MYESMGLIPLSSTRTVPICGELSRYPSYFSMPFAGVAVVHDDSRTVDLIFSAKVAADPSARPGVFDYLTLQDIFDAVHAEFLEISAPSTVVNVFNNEKAISTSYGQAGLKFAFAENGSAAGGLGRNNASLESVALWPLSGNFINGGEVYSFFMFDAAIHYKEG